MTFHIQAYKRHLKRKQQGKNSSERISWRRQLDESRKQQTETNHG